MSSISYVFNNYCFTNIVPHDISKKKNTKKGTMKKVRVEEHRSFYMRLIVP